MSEYLTASMLQDLDPVRLYASMSRTCLFLQFNFQRLSDVGFSLLAEPRMWTAGKNRKIIQSKNTDEMYLNIDWLKDKALEAEAKNLIHRLRFGDEPEHVRDSSNPKARAGPSPPVAVDNTARPAVRHVNFQESPQQSDIPRQTDDPQQSDIPRQPDGPRDPGAV